MPNETKRSLRLHDLTEKKKFSGNNHLVVIAFNEYQQPNDWHTCMKEAEDFITVLIQNNHFDSGNVVRLFDDQATKAAIGNTFRELRQKIAGGDSLVVYIAGQGEIDETTKGLLKPFSAFHTSLITDAFYYEGPAGSGIQNLGDSESSQTPGFLNGRQTPIVERFDGGEGDPGESVVQSQVENSFLDPRNGQKYQTIEIRGKLWMAENLNYEIEDSWGYRNTLVQRHSYGRLYTWETARKACPPGWRLPTNEEWADLIDYYGKGKGTYNALLIGGSSGFNALLGGGCRAKSRYFNLGTDGYYWSGTEKDAGHAFYYNFNLNHSKLYQNTNSKMFGFSCRCLKDVVEGEQFPVKGKAYLLYF